MSRPARISGRARSDIAEIVLYLDRSPQAVRRLRDAVAHAATLIGAYPEIGRYEPHLADKPFRF